MTNPTVESTLPSTAARDLLERVRDHDGVDAFSEQFLAGLDDERLGHVHLVTRGSESGAEKAGLRGIAALAPDGSVELAVDPGYRRAGIGSALAAAVFARTEDASFWAHGNLPAAQGLAAHLGLVPGRELLVMAVKGDLLHRAAELPEGAIPEGFAALSYPEAVEKWGEDTVKDAWLAANNDAFEWHPEQGGWDRDRLDRAMEATWFDPAGVRLLYEGDSLAGFHWTKVHSGETGEVYVVGLDSSYRGRDLGDPLLRMGLNYLVGQGNNEVKLYVESGNLPAVRRYEKLGFLTVERHVVYRKNSS